MNDNKASIVMTEEQLERVITIAVKKAVNELNAEKELPGNQVNELKEAPATFSLVSFVVTLFLGGIVSIAVLFIIACVYLIYKNGFNIGILLLLLSFIIIGILAIVSMYEVDKTKKVEVINTVFNVATGLSSLIVAIIGAYFAYKGLK